MVRTKTEINQAIKTTRKNILCPSSVYTTEDQREMFANLFLVI